MTAPTAEIGEVRSVRRISDAAWDMEIHAPLNTAACRAGHFVHVRVGEGFAPVLRRPLSVGPCRDGMLRLLFTVKGKGTRLLADKRVGDKIDIIGPLGTSFPVPEADVMVLVAGGIGIVPLLLLDDQLPSSHRRQFLAGFRSGNLITVDHDEIKQRKMLVATDDGTLGRRGTVISLLEESVDSLRPDKIAVFGCGPGPMLAALKRFCVERGIQAFASLEVPMGCGLGACQSCAVPRADGKGYLLVCHDGPVFDVRDVDLRPEVLP